MCCIKASYFLNKIMRNLKIFSLATMYYVLKYIQERSLFFSRVCYLNVVMPRGFKQVKINRPRKNKSRDILKESNFNSQEYFNRKLQKAKEEFEASQLWFEILQSINESLQSINSDSINEILCYGLGNFTEKKSSLYQFIALVKFQKQYDCFVTIYDPAFTALEDKILISLGFKILSENEEGKRKISNDQITLVYLPHCPKQLTNNFLWANWGPALTKCILINNSFAKILQDNTGKILAEAANYIVKIFPKTKEISFECVTDIFNDISVHYFEAECDFFTQTLDKEPMYTSDTEFITKEVQKLNLK